MTQAHAAPAVVADKLRRTYGDFVAVDDVSFEVAQGEIFGFLGPMLGRKRPACNR